MGDSDTKAKTVSISVPALAEQRRIVAMIETLLPPGDEPLLKDSFLSRRFRREVLSVAFSRGLGGRIH